MLAQIASCNIKMEFDDPEKILDAAFEEGVISSLKSKSQFETQDEYQQRIAAAKAATNLDGKVFTILIPIGYVGYDQYEKNPAQWFVALKEKGTSCLRVAVRTLSKESVTRQTYMGKDRRGREMFQDYTKTIYSTQTLELIPQDTLIKTAMAWQLRERRSMSFLFKNPNPYHFGLLIDNNDTGFRKKMSDRAISLAIRFNVKNIQSLSYSDRSDYAGDTRKIVQLPVCITDVWCVDITDNSAFAHWSSNKDKTKG